MTEGPKYDRRAILTRATVGAAAVAATAGLAAPAIAQGMPAINWRLASAFPRNLDTIHGGAIELADRLREATDGKLNLQIFAAGEIVPGLESINAASSGTVEAAHAPGYYNWGRDPAFAAGSCLPFTFNARGQNAYMYQQGGLGLYNTFLAKYALTSFPTGNTGTQMGGWYRKEINSLADLQGLKMRISGLAGQVLAKLGVVPQQIAGGDVYAALERGTLDAAEFSGPYDDEKLGFVKVAPFYYYPGFWEGGPMVSVFFHKPAFDALPSIYKSLIKTAAAAVDHNMLAKYDAKNPAALKRLVGQGTQLRPFPEDVLLAAFDAANQTYAEVSAANADFKRQWDALQAFRNDWYLYAQTADYQFDTFMMIMQRNGRLAPTAE